MSFKLSPFEFKYKAQGHNSSDKKIFLKKELVIEKNGLYLIAGESGSGKSTFLNLLKGISPKFTSGNLIGEIKYKDINVAENGFELFKNKIVYLFQNPFSQIIHRIVELEFAFTLENLNYDKKKYFEVMKNLRDRFSLSKIWNSDAFKLSNGECQKLVLASLVATGPEVLLLDEPTAFLDPEARNEFYKLISELKKEHIIFLVDHHLSEIKSIVDHAFYVESNGEIKFSQIDTILNKQQGINESRIINDYGFKKNTDQFSITLNDVSFSYREKEDVFKNLNLSFSSGEVIVIKGKNGEGKSTFLKLVSGIISPSKGNVLFKKNEKEIKKKNIDELIGFIFQNPESNFFFDTLKEELLNKDEHFISYFFSEYELQRSPFLFSEGQKRRISILINLILEKKILFLDEPTFGQDLENKNKIIDMVLEMKEKGYLQMIISHDEDFIKKVGTKVYELKNKGLNEIKSI
jgi:energy-coupling factor transporter ATP-binding protein EcfA2